jgi:cystathionine beta-lyase/cystathionine gamma-synthase
VIQFMNRLQMIVPGTSLGDVHTMLLFPVMASHRDVAPGTRQRMGIKDNLVRVSAGIEAVDDIISDLDRALHACRT